MTCKLCQFEKSHSPACPKYKGFKASDFEKSLRKTYEEAVKPEVINLAVACAKTEVLPSWAEEIFNSSGYYLDDKERVRLDIDQKELEKIIRQTIKTKRAEAYQEGFIAGADATGSQMNELKIEELKKAQEQAVKEVIEEIKENCPRHKGIMTNYSEPCICDILNKLKAKYDKSLL